MKYTILGDSLPVVICELEDRETIIAQAGAMSWMSPNITLTTSTNGGAGKALGRMFAGERMFQCNYTANGPGQIAFSSSFPGSILAIDITPDKPLVVQKSGFLACEKTVEPSLFWQKKLGAGFFGGEGFVLNKLSGTGKAFIEVDGYCCTYDLAPGQEMILDTGYLAAMSATCTMDIVSVKGLKNIFFGGEGLFNTVVKGPGRVMVQSMPRSAVAASLGVFNNKS